MTKEQAITALGVAQTRIRELEQQVEALNGQVQREVQSRNEAARYAKMLEGRLNNAIHLFGGGVELLKAPQ